MTNQNKVAHNTTHNAVLSDGAFMVIVVQHSGGYERVRVGSTTPEMVHKGIPLGQDFCAYLVPLPMLQS